MLALLRYFFLSLFLGLSLVGYSYFGPTSHTRFFTHQSWYKKFIMPFFEEIFQLAPSDSHVVAELSSFRGDLSVRPQSELVYVPAREEQALTAGTMVSSGENSSAKIILLDKSVLTLEASSVVLIEAPLATRVEEQSITLKIIRGAVAAKKEKKSTVQVNLVSTKGIVRSVSSDKKLVVIAQKKNSAILSKLSDEAKISQLTLPDEEETFDELIGTVGEKQDVAAIQKKLFNDQSLVAARVRSASAKMISNNSEREIDLDQLAEMTSRLESQVRANPRAEKLDLAAINAESLKKAGLSEVADEFIEEVSKPLEVEKELNKISSQRIAQAAKYASLDVAAELAQAAPINISKITTLPEIPSQVRLLQATDMGSVSRREPSAEAAGDFNASNATTSRQDDASGLNSSMKNPATAKATQRKKSNIRKSVNTLSNKTGNFPSSKARQLASSGFTDPTQAAVDSLLTNFIQTNNCASALGVLQDVKRNFSRDSRVKSWVAKWAPVYNGACVPLGSSRSEISD